MELSEEAKAARRAYNRQWAAENRDKRQAAQARYWQKKAEQAKKEEEDNGEN